MQPQPNGAGLNALALTIAVKTLAVNPERAIALIGTEIENLSTLPAPEISQTIRLLKANLLAADWQRLEQVKDRIEMRVLVGSDCP